MKMKDSFNRDINYLRVSITDRCNLRCRYCMDKDGLSNKLVHDDILTFDEIAAFVKICANNGISSVRITGGEPLVRKGVPSLVYMLNQIDGIKDVSMTTNGILLPKYAKQLKDAGLKRINISLDTLDPQTFKTITRIGNLEDVFAGIKCAIDTEFSPIKINCVANKSHNINYYEIAKLSIKNNLHIRFIEYMPIGLNYNSSNFVPWKEILESINASALKNNGQKLVEYKAGLDGKGPAKYYKFENALGTVGFISAISDQFCNTCNRIRLTADGKIRPCLFYDKEYDINKYLKNGDLEKVEQMFIYAIENKPKAHAYNLSTIRHMNQIGG